ncbi:SET and MYND domain-containing protein [Lachnellula suecica]|uniref:SET and MYND domain-containing protein n=1 Tax=Lachnellula suecica TaxID=602035 RepID=A0A8T9C8E2_9HELO|nr:SET and MYND domain-containing protein [Lachnellula suecica]
MDSPWSSAEKYKPSSGCEVAPYVPLDPDQFAAESSEVIRFTQLLATFPYDPETWLNRGNCLRLLGYPELALGDVYKARLLVEAGLEDTPSILGNDVRKAFRKKTYDMHTKDPAWMKWADAVSTPELLAQRVEEMLKRLELQIWTETMEGLMAANCCGDYVRMSREAMDKFPDDEFFPSEVSNADAWYAQRETILKARVENGEMDEGQMMSTLLNGGVYPTPYPFLTEDFLVRDELVFKGIKEDFKRVSTNCMVVRSTIRNTPAEEGSEATTEDDCIGVIATRDIGAGETVLIDEMSAGSVGVDADPGGCPTCCANPVQNFWNTCCVVLYCSQACADVAGKTFHGPICGRDFNYLYTAAKKATTTTDFTLDALLLMRVLALSLEEGAEHPLKSELLVRLTPAYGFKEPNLIIFNFEDHVQTPISILQTLDINIFTNQLYDTWVLHTIKCRLQNNKHGQTLEDWPGTSISGLYSMLNHSCSPNVDWRHDTGSNAVTMFTTRDCKKGEELCISYIGSQMNGMPVAERRKKLMGWFGMACRCGKCNEEADRLETDSDPIPIR